MFNEKTHHLCKLSLLANFFGKKVTNQALDRYSKRPEVTISATLRKKKSEEVKSVSHSFVSLCDPMDCSPPGSSVHGVVQARKLEWVANPFSSGPCWPRD